LRKDLLFLTVVLVFALSVSVVAFFVSYQNPLRYSVRIFALLGFMFLSIAVILTAFLKEVTLYFKDCRNASGFVALIRKREGELK